MTLVSLAVWGLQIAIEKYIAGSQVSTIELYSQQELHSHPSLDGHSILDHGTTTQLNQTKTDSFSS